MNRDHGIEIGFGCAHFHRDTKTLDHFINRKTDAV
ncbi:Uncharacterised protein [Vibrio cholerae]|uniref:Uncharacterized protein n=1 Tax=Vibrio cholerae TaxID=666 RepID=A0A655ZA65_VIBCL|nr:Uncharacterised protein [Vibrio cholerae]